MHLNKYDEVHGLCSVWSSFIVFHMNRKPFNKNKEQCTERGGSLFTGIHMLMLTQVQSQMKGIGRMVTFLCLTE